jgi:hypothetical protein
MSPRRYTPKQMGDACEMLVASEITLAGVPALKMPDNWPGYDVIAQPTDNRGPQRISVKARTFRAGEGAFLDYYANCEFDWLAIVLLPGPGQVDRRFFIVPKAVADDRLHHPRGKDPNDKYCRLDKVAKIFREFENNFQLSIPMDRDSASSK